MKLDNSYRLEKYIYVAKTKKQTLVLTNTDTNPVFLKKNCVLNYQKFNKY